ncbi:MAG: hypothetical protein E7370_02895 [Clostridiales bacterium]|nr:hypothetical protein [Clostridiales bacterium]
MTSVGFSAWTITGTSPSVYVSGTVSADQVINSNDYINTTEYSCFYYCPDGFVNESKVNNETIYTLADSGNFIINYNIYLAKCKNLFKTNYVQINLNFGLLDSTILSTNYNFFYAISSVSVVATVNGNSVLVANSISSTPTNSYHNATVKLNMSSLTASETVTASNTCTFTVTYTFSKSIGTGTNAINAMPAINNVLNATNIKIDTTLIGVNS